MGSISEIVTVNITSAGVAIKQSGFGVPMIADYHTKNLDRIRFYSDLAGMAADGFVPNDSAYRAAAAVFAQSPQVPLLAIGRRALNPIIQVRITPSASNLTIYSVDVIGPAGSGTATYTSTGSATVALICTGLTAAINALALGVTATDNTTTVTILAGVATNWFSISPTSLSLMVVEQIHADPGIATDLAAIQLVNNDWYGVTLTTMGKAEVVAAAAWVEQNEKLGVFSTQDTTVINATAANVALTAQTATDMRSNIFYSYKGNEMQGAALLGYLSFPPGSLTFEFKALAGISVSPLTSTHIVNLNAANAGFYASYGGVGMFRDSKTAGGSFMDLIRDRDWLKARMQTRILTLLASNPKVPFTDAGIAAVEAEVRSQLTEAVTAGYLADSPKPVVTVPKASAVNPTDKANRTLQPVNWSATAQGAIHKVTINGTVSV